MHSSHAGVLRAARFPGEATAGVSGEGELSLSAISGEMEVTRFPGLGEP